MTAETPGLDGHKDVAIAALAGSDATASVGRGGNGWASLPSKTSSRSAVDTLERESDRLGREHSLDSLGSRRCEECSFQGSGHRADAGAHLRQFTHDMFHCQRCQDRAKRRAVIAAAAEMEAAESAPLSAQPSFVSIGESLSDLSWERSEASLPEPRVPPDHHKQGGFPRPGGSCRPAALVGTIPHTEDTLRQSGHLPYVLTDEEEAVGEAESMASMNATSASVASMASATSITSEASVVMPSASPALVGRFNKELPALTAPTGAAPMVRRAPAPPSPRHHGIGLRKPRMPAGAKKAPRKSEPTVATRETKLVLTAEEKLERQTSQIGKIVRDAIASNRSLGGKAMKNIEGVFKAIDKDGSGDLDHKEFATAMKRLGLGLTADQIKQCIEVLDKDGDGEVSLDEFMALVNKPVKTAVKAIGAANAFAEAGAKAALARESERLGHEQYLDDADGQEQEQEQAQARPRPGQASPSSSVLDALNDDDDVWLPPFGMSLPMPPANPLPLPRHYASQNPLIGAGVKASRQKLARLSTPRVAAKDALHAPRATLAATISQRSARAASKDAFGRGTPSFFERNHAYNEVDSNLNHRIRRCDLRLLRAGKVTAAVRTASAGRAPATLTGGGSARGWPTAGGQYFVRHGYTRTVAGAGSMTERATARQGLGWTGTAWYGSRAAYPSS